MPKTSAVARSGCCSGISFDEIPCAITARTASTGVGEPGASLLNWPCCTKSRNRKRSGSSSFAWTEAANHRGELSACGRLGKCQRLESPGKLHVVALEYLPHEFVFPVEVAIQSPLRDIDSPSDIPNGRRVDALLGEELNRRPLDALPRVGEAVSWHNK